MLPDKPRRPAAAVAALAAALLLAACTSDPEPTGTAPPPLSVPTTSRAATATTAPAGPGPTAGVPTGLPAGGPVPAGFTVSSVTNVRGATYALGTAPCTTAPCTSVVRSTDGGRTWRGVPAPKVELAADAESRDPDAGTVRELRFATPADGWAFGGGLWSTHDGGARWTKVDVGGSVLDLATTATTAYALVATCKADGSSCAGTRLLSSATARDAFGRVAGVTLPPTGFGGVTTGAAGVVVAVSGATYVAPAGAGFRRVTVPCANPAAEVVAAAGDRAVVAFCGEGAAAGSSMLSIRVSTDGGATWAAAGSGGGARVPNGLLTFAAATRSTLAVASASRDLRGALLVSANGGATFTKAAVPASSAGWRYVGAAGASTFVAIPEPAQDGYRTSSDGGRTWVRIGVR